MDDARLSGLQAVSAADLPHEMHLAEWDLWREGELFGPLTLHELGELKRDEALRPHDIAVCFPRELKARPDDLPALPADVIPARPLQVNRRYRRAPADGAVKLKSADGDFTGALSDISARGAAFVSSAVFETGSEVVFKTERTRFLPEIDTLAVVVSAVPCEHGIRYGVRFPILSHKIVSALKDAVKRRA